MPIFYLMTDNTGLSNLWLNKTSSCSWKALIMSSINEGCCSAFVNRFCISDSRSLTSTLLRCFKTICRQAISLTNGFIAFFAMKIFDNSLSVPVDVIWLAEINSIQIRNEVDTCTMSLSHIIFQANRSVTTRQITTRRNFASFRRQKFPVPKKCSGPPVPAAGKPESPLPITYYSSYRNRTVCTLTKKQKRGGRQWCWLAGTKKWKGLFGRLRA